MSREHKFDFSISGIPDIRGAMILKAYTDAFRNGLTEAGIAVAMHRSEPNIKNVAYVNDKSGSITIRTKFHDGSTFVLHTYRQPAVDIDVGYSWSANVTIADGEVTVH